MRSETITLPHLSIASLNWGDTDKPVMLALHGWLDNAASFLPIAECFPRYFPDYQLVALDMPGHGYSSHRSPDAHYHLVDFVQDLHAVIEQQGWSQVTFLVHSLGGIIASLYTACFPERVKALVCMESMGCLTEDAHTSPQQLRESIISRLELNQKKVKHPDSLKSAIRARKTAGDLSTQAATLLVERNIESRDGAWVWRTDRRLRSVSSLRMTEAQAEAFLQAISCPMLVILGDQGFSKVANNLNQRGHLVKNLSSVTVSGGHHLHMDNPQDVAEQVAGFLHKLP